MVSSPSHIRQIFVTGRASSSMKLSVSLYSGDLGKITNTHILIDSKATGISLTMTLLPETTGLKNNSHPLSMPTTPTAHQIKTE